MGRDSLTVAKWGMLSRARHRAKKYGIPFALSLDDITIPERCPVLGIQLKVVKKRGGGDSSPSLDRIDPSGPYSPENTIVVSLKANRMKSTASPEEMLRVACYYSQLEKDKDD